MLRFAEVQFALSAVQADGATLKQHLDMVARQTGEMPEELKLAEQAPCPDGLAHVWMMFLDLHRARSSNGFGANPISYSEMFAWSSMNGLAVTPYEIGALRQLDSAWMTEQEKASKAKRKTK